MRAKLREAAHYSSSPDHLGPLVIRVIVWLPGLATIHQCLALRAAAGCGSHFCFHIWSDHAGLSVQPISLPSLFLKEDSHYSYKATCHSMDISSDKKHDFRVIKIKSKLRYNHMHFGIFLASAKGYHFSACIYKHSF